MFCQNCGAPNSDDAVFCESCGAKLEKEDKPFLPNGQNGGNAINGNNASYPAQAIRTVMHKPISKLTVVLIAEVIALVAVVYAIFSIGEKGFGAEQEATNYFINIANGDWEKAYKKLDIEESEFINSQMFAEANKENYLGSVNNYEVRTNSQNSPLEQGSSLGTVVTIDYRVKGNTENSSYAVTVNKQADKRYLFFDNWKVGASNLICQDYSIYVPQGASVAVDGILLDDKYAAADNVENGDYYEDVNLSHYVIPQIFYGIHSITVSMEDRKDIADTIQIGYDNTQYYVENMQFKDEVLTELIQMAGEDMQQIYNAALAGKNLKTIENLFSQKEEYMESIKESYDILLSGMNEGSSVPAKISFSDITGNVYNNGTSVEVSFAYEVEYTYEDWWSGERKKDRYQGTDEWSFYFVKEDGNWVLANLGCENLYY